VRTTAAVRFVLAALSLAVLLLTAPHAAAHTVLTGSDPAADAALDAGPARVTATFNEDLQPTFAAMTVVGPDGNLWSQGDTVVKGPTASVGLRPLGPSGRYTVNYRVTSDDGHVVSGAWSFTVKVASTGAPGPAAAPATHDRIPLWPFIVGVAVLAAGAVAWGLRRRS
jgi:methionine-rich copper-binding protein CopC